MKTEESLCSPFTSSQLCPWILGVFVFHSRYRKGCCVLKAGAVLLCADPYICLFCEHQTPSQRLCSVLTDPCARSMWLGWSPRPVNQPGHQTAKRNTLPRGVFTLSGIYWCSMVERLSFLTHYFSGVPSWFARLCFQERLSLSITF